MKIFDEYRKLSHSELLYVIFLGFVWTNAYFDTLWRRLFHVQETEFSDVINFILLILLAFLCRNQWIQRHRLSDMFLCLLLAFSYFLCGIIYPHVSDEISENAISVLCASLPYLIIGILFNHKDYQYWIKIFSCAAVVLNFLYLFMRASNGEEAYEEQMRKSYSLLPSVIYLLYCFIERRKITDLLFLSFGFLILCSLGSRGPLVCLILFTALYLLFLKEYKHKILIRSLIVGISTFMIAFTQYFAEFMIMLLASFGMKSRIFDKMLNDAFVNYESSSGRNDIQEKLIQRLNTDSSGIGFGPFSDREVNFGWYAHNIIVELWYDYGYYIGSAIMVIIAFLIIRFMIKTCDRDAKVFVLLLFCASIVKLMFSGSYLQDSNLYFMIGVCIYGLRQTKITYNSIK